MTRPKAPDRTTQSASRTLAEEACYRGTAQLVIASKRWPPARERLRQPVIPIYGTKERGEANHFAVEDERVTHGLRSTRPCCSLDNLRWCRDGSRHIIFI